MGTEKGPTWLKHHNYNTSFPPSSRVSKEVPDLKLFKAEGGWVGKGNTHTRTGLMAFLMLPKAARPSSSRRHLSASSAGISFSFSGAWRGEGDRLWKHTAHG